MGGIIKRTQSIGNKATTKQKVRSRIELEILIPRRRRSRVERVGCVCKFLNKGFWKIQEVWPNLRRDAEF